MAARLVVSDDEGEDERLLSLVAMAEASALAAKRRKVFPSSQVDSASGGRGGRDSPSAEEGSYTAALRGSRSALWKQQQGPQRQPQVKLGVAKGAGGERDGGASAAGSCFKCGQLGHWARDCTGGGRGDVEPARRQVADGGEGPRGDVIGKPCPCGLGDCLVLTSNTPKNPGRRFYRCPVKEENGGCNFFEWCDNSTSGVSASRSFYGNSSSVPNLPCPCGAGSCLVLTAKTGNSVGQQFYRCPLDQGAGSCGFFKWCNQLKPSAHLSENRPCFNVSKQPNYQHDGAQGASVCFKCGHAGHWAKDCVKNEFDSPRIGENKAASSGLCFKCGEVGHWARDCTSQSTTPSAGRGKVFDTTKGSYFGESR